MRSETVVIGNKEVGIKLLLELQEILECAKIIAKVQFSGGTNPADYHFFHKGKIRKIAGDLREIAQKWGGKGLCKEKASFGVYFCAMPKTIQLKFTPAEMGDEAGVNRRFCVEARDPSAVVVWKKKSLDARGRQPYFLVTADVYAPGEEQVIEAGFQLRDVTGSKEVHVIGAGPAGLYCALELIELGLKPIVLERGKAVKERRRDLAVMNREKVVNAESNYCFGEGGAGTYSDGKLYTRSNKRGPVQKVLQSLVDHGAPEAIKYEAHPHIGTNKLPQLVEGLRKTIEDCGGEVRFNQRVDGLTIVGGKVKSLLLNGGESLAVAAVVLATGHSARDIFEMLDRSGVAIEAKPFAIGVRLEHPQALIDQIQYKCEFRGDGLPPSSYSLVEQIQGRGVFSFCMCPGGIIAPAATAPGEVVVNGWSPSKRNGKFANSGYVVTVDDRDFSLFDKAGALRALRYQQHWEQRAFQVTGSLSAPAQRMEDFIQGKVSANLPENSYLPGLISANVGDVLSENIHRRIRESLVVLGKKMKGFRTNEAILVGVESRTSSPVRIPRLSDSLQHTSIGNLFPCGEGAGYAGGIMSAALDGMRVANAVLAVFVQER